MTEDSGKKRRHSVPVMVFLAARQVAELLALSERECQPFARLVRDAVKAYLAGHRAKPAEQRDGSGRARLMIQKAADGCEATALLRALRELRAAAIPFVGATSPEDFLSGADRVLAVVALHTAAVTVVGEADAFGLLDEAGERGASGGQDARWEEI